MRTAAPSSAARLNAVIALAAAIASKLAVGSSQMIAGARRARARAMARRWSSPPERRSSAGSTTLLFFCSPSSSSVTSVFAPRPSSCKMGKISLAVALGAAYCTARVHQRRASCCWSLGPRETKDGSSS
mmetsp:Transcript_20448/g.55059  ORF Transcript_20448/g.55059 Transcript_20448/m.55059 type:complete len:129 (-) Transcript_20448:222-608(-)